ERAYFRHTMRYEKYGYPSRFGIGDYLTQPINITTGERGGRFIQQQNRRVAKQGPGDLDFLTDCETEFAWQRIQIDLNIKLVEEMENLAPHARSVQGPGNSPRCF